MKIAITGAPHSGKTTLIKKLSDKFEVVPESAIIVINAIQDLVPHGALAWRREYFESFQWLITQKQRELELPYEDSSKIVFLDRGAHDGKAFALKHQSEVPKSAQNIMDSCHYHMVFILDLVLPFDPRSGTGRIETEKDCHELDLLLELVYRREGYEPVRVPLMPVEERVNFILKHLKILTPKDHMFDFSCIKCDKQATTRDSHGYTVCKDHV